MTPTNSYRYGTKPFRHQKRLFERTRELAAYAIFWEQGCGKTKPTIDTAAWLYDKQCIDALLVVAPNGVHRNWVNDEIPLHMPESTAKQTFAVCYQSPKAGTKWHQALCERVLVHKGLAVLAMSYDGFMTEAGKKLAWKFLKKRKCLYVVDEAHAIKTPGAKRTKSIVASGRYAPYKRILTGTPIAQGPFDVYTQMRFLDEKFWLPHQLGSFGAFKNYFGVWRKRADVLEATGYDPGYDELLGYRFLEDLQKILDTLSDRVTKDEVLDLPPKLYSKRYFDMTKKQATLYKELRDEFIAEMEDGTVIDGDMAIVRLLRLQQITCGYAQTDSLEPIRLVDEHNPRLQAALDIAEGLGHKAIFWCRFRHDVDQLMQGLPIGSAVRYDGSVSDDDCEEAKNEFQKGKAQFFVANTAKGKEGLTLHAARTVVYYSNSFKMVDRLQSEDRAHRIGQEHPVNYIDLIAPGTIDEYIVKSLRAKYDIASQITGDKLKEWL